MNKKPGLLFSIYALAIVMLAAAFKWNLFNAKSSALQSKNVAEYLFVCPMTSSKWDLIANIFSKGEQYISMAVFFVIIVLLFAWGWALYQNLLKDKFNADAYKNPWLITKIAFWATIVCIILMKTPNHFRPQIHINSTNWVLCENTSENARAVRIKSH